MVIGFQPSKVKFGEHEQIMFKAISNKNYRGFRYWNGRYETTALSVLLGTNLERLAKQYLKEYYYAIDGEKLIVFGNTYPIKEDLKRSMGFKWGGHVPVAHWIARYSYDVAKQLNDKYAMNIPLPEIKDVTILKIAGSWINVYNVGRHHINAISNLMMYWMKGAEFTDSFKEGRWGGYIRLFDFKAIRFPIGFLSIVIDYFKQSNIEYEIKDERKIKSKLNLNWHGHELRDYQIEAVQKAKEVGFGFLVLPTGAGKTEIGMKLIQELNVSSLIIVHRSELLYQWKERLEKSLNVEIGIIGDKHYDEKSITVAMIQTASRNTPKRHYDCLIVDEAHHTPADTYYNLAGKINAMYRFGLSATPYREDGDEMKITGMTGAVNKLVSIRDLINRGYIADPRFEYISGYEGNDSDDSWQNELESACFDAQTNEAIVNKAINLTEQGYKVYIDVRRIAHGKLLADMLAKSLKCEFIYGRHSSKTRQRVLKEFRTEKMILISTLIKEGVDLPEMSAIILAGPAKSSTENIQKVGRALRPKPGNNHAIIVDREDRSYHLQKWCNARKKVFFQYYEMEDKLTSKLDRIKNGLESGETNNMLDMLVDATKDLERLSKFN